MLPAGGGKLSLARNDLARVASLVAELIALLVICVLALPGKRADPVEEAEALAALREARQGRRATAGRGERTPRSDGAGRRAALASATAGAGRLGLARKRLPGRRAVGADDETFNDTDNETGTLTTAPDDAMAVARPAPLALTPTRVAVTGAGRAHLASRGT